MAGIIFSGRTQKLTSSLIRFTVRDSTAPKRHWYSIARELPLSSSPWLRLPKDMRGPQMVVYDNFLNLVDKRLVKLDMLMSYGSDIDTVCVGSSRGTLAYVTERCKMCFVYPYTGGGITFLHYGPAENDECDHLHSSTRCYTQVGDVHTFLCEPRQHLVSWTPINHLEFYIGMFDVDSDWTRYPYLFQKDDPPIAYCATTRTVYKLSRDLEHRQYIELWDPFEHPIKVKSRFYVATTYITMDASERELRARCQQHRYLVVTEDSGEVGPCLYLVIRHHNRELGISQTRAMDVFKFDLVERRMTQTTELDNHAFFIGSGSDPFAVALDKCPELKPDSIYVSDDLQVFDLKNCSITSFVELGDLYMTRPQTFWVPPLSPGQVDEV